MNSTRMTLALVVALSFVGAADSMAQRRTADGGGSGGGGGGGGGDTRSTPASSGGSGRSSTPSRGRDESSSPVYSRPSNGGSSGGSSYGGRSGSMDRRGAQNSSGTRSANGTRGTTGNRPQTGKIGAIKKAAQAARTRPATGGGVFIGTCWGCNYWGWYGDQWGVYNGGWWYPSNYPPPDYYPADGYASGGKGGSDQGYQPYPYAGADSTSETFAERHASVRRSYGAVTMTYFSDAGSTTKAGQIGLEGAIGQLRGELEYAHYAEPVIGHTDHLQTLRFGLAGQPRLSSNAYLIAGVAARGVFLDDGSRAWGPEGELGLQVFPVRPFGLNVTGRLAGLSWNGNDYFEFKELNTTGSVFINRIEIQGGWHWMKIGGSPAFGGPVLGMRVWF